MIEVIDDFAPKEYFDLITYACLGWNQTWYYQNNITAGVWESEGLGKHGFNCWIVQQPNTFCDNYAAGLLTDLIVNMQRSLGCENVMRSRLDMTMYTPGGRLCDAHIDNPNQHTATIFYLNDSDGNTVIYNEKFEGDTNIDQSKLTIKQEIEPKANRLLIFDGFHFHTGHVPQKHNTRVLLNSNFN
tara:strand:- start:30 stop:587 length:558 start_codon:yes stop_codon:yes gene_type:complete